MNWDLIIAVLAGIGTAVGTLVGLESYLSKKFVRAVRLILMDLNISHSIEDLQEQMGGLQKAITTLEERIERGKQADIRAHATLNATRMKAEKLETAIRLLADEDQRSSITAIFESSGFVPRED